MPLCEVNAGPRGAVALGLAVGVVLLSAASARAVNATLEASNLGLTSSFIGSVYDTSTGNLGIDFQPITSLASSPTVSVVRGPQIVTGSVAFDASQWSASLNLRRGGTPRPDGFALSSANWRMVFRMNEPANLTLDGLILVPSGTVNDMSVSAALYDVTTVDDFSAAASLLLMSETNSGLGTESTLNLGTGAGQTSVFFYTTKTATLQANRRYFLEYSWSVKPAGGLADAGQANGIAGAVASFTAVPEPTTMTLVAGAAMLLTARRRK